MRVKMGRAFWEWAETGRAFWEWVETGSPQMGRAFQEQAHTGQVKRKGCLGNGFKQYRFNQEWVVSGYTPVESY